MKPEEQRIAIAEWCGWTSVVDSPARLDVVGYRPDEKDLGLVPLPDYLNDLNAMHEAESKLTNEQQNDYMDKLDSVIPFDKGRAYTEFHLFHATASQRAEALLRTIGKWIATDQRKDK